MTPQTHLREMTMILPMAVITDASDAKEETSEKGSDQKVRSFNGKTADDSV